MHVLLLLLLNDRALFSTRKQGITKAQRPLLTHAFTTRYKSVAPRSARLLGKLVYSLLHAICQRWSLGTLFRVLIV